MQKPKHQVVDAPRAVLSDAYRILFDVYSAGPLAEQLLPRTRSGTERLVARQTE